MILYLIYLVGLMIAFALDSFVGLHPAYAYIVGFIWGFIANKVEVFRRC